MRKQTQKEKGVCSKSLQTRTSFLEPHMGLGLLIPLEDAFFRELVEWHQRTAGEHWSRTEPLCPAPWFGALGSSEPPKPGSHFSAPICWQGRAS